MLFDFSILTFLFARRKNTIPNLLLSAIYEDTLARDAEKSDFWHSPDLHTRFFKELPPCHRLSDRRPLTYGQHCRLVNGVRAAK